MARQHIDYTTSALSPPNAPADDGLDTGSADATAIRPVIDGQPAQAAVFKRPSENLRTRTEKIRTELENLKYLSDADRALLLTGPGSITWNGQGPGAFPLGTFQLTPATSLTVKPFLAPATSIPSRLIICAGTIAQITFRTIRTAGSAPRAYSGANDITIDFQPVSVGTGTVIVTATGTPANNVHVQYDSHPTTFTTVDQTVGNSLIQQFNASAVALSLGLEAVFEGGGTPPEVGYPPPPLVSAAAKIDTYISAPEKATRFMSGAADAEKHVIPETQLVTFFTDPLNALIDGDTLCIRYEDLVMSPTDGGRRQSIADLPENNLTIPAGSLFLLRRFPDRLPLAIPVCAVAGGQLVFINGRVYGAGESGPLVASGASYQGSNAAPNSWADNTVLSGTMPVSFETALDTIIQTLGAVTSPSGAHKVGIPAISGSPISAPAGGVHAAISNVITGANTHINNGTGAHAASAISYAGNTNVSATDVEGALDELDNEKAGIALANTFTQTNTFAEVHTTGNVGVRTATPGAPLDVAGQNNWDTSSTEGDFRIGNPTYRIKMGIATGGGGAGAATIAAQGGLNLLQLGAGTTLSDQQALRVTGGNVGVGVNPTEKLTVDGNTSVPAANDFKYATARTRTVWYSPSEMQLLTPGTQNLTRGVGSGQKQINHGITRVSMEQRDIVDASSNGSDTVLMFWSNTWGKSRARIVIPVRGIPSGATVTAIRVLGEQAGNGAGLVNSISAEVRLKTRGIGAGFNINGPTILTPGGTPSATGWTPVDLTTGAFTHSINHNSNLHEIQVDIILDYKQTNTMQTGSANSAWGAAASPTLNGCFIATGGHDNFTPTVTSNEAFLIDPRIGITKTLATMATPRAFHSQRTIEKDNAVFVVGGRNHALVATGSVEVYYPSSNTWNAVGTATAGRYPTLIPNPASDGIYSVGGSLVGGGNTAVVEEIKASGVTTRASLPIALRQHAMSYVQHVGTRRLMVTGGLDGFSSAQTTSYFYHPEADSWATGGGTQNMTAARYGHAQLTLSNGFIFVAGGNNASAEMYNPFIGRWITLAGHAALGNANSRDGENHLIEVPGGVIYATPDTPFLYYDFRTNVWTRIESTRHGSTATFIDGTGINSAAAVSESGTVLNYGTYLTGQERTVWVMDPNIPSVTNARLGIGFRLSGVALEYSYTNVNSET